jgi:hypothetical protein
MAPPLAGEDPRPRAGGGMNVYRHSLPRKLAGLVMVIVFVEGLYGYVYGVLLP